MPMSVLGDANQPTFSMVLVADRMSVLSCEWARG
jgi:hypothetical protein